MARAGRKRKHVQRQPNGQPSRSRPAAREDLLAVVRQQPHRRRYTSTPQGDLSHDQRAECELGRLSLDGLIEPHHYEAGVQYRAAVRNMRAAIGAPPGTPQAQDFNRGGGKGNAREEDEEAAKRANRARSVYADAYVALGDAGRDAVLAVNDLVVWDRSRAEIRGGMGNLHRGLTALARHFGLLGRRA